ncbi:McrB family protein [Vibrio campbellii]|uniref:McrB family protein n=1 Tax=Vibrio campbellii TaxID=680 RepID=UPI003D0B096E
METSNQYSGETSLAEFFNQYKDATAKWHTGYKRTCETIQNDPDITDETLALIWYQRDNYVSSLMQGATSQEEFERAKSSLRELTLRIKAEPSAEMYIEAQRVMLEYKSKQLLNKNYKALLNRAFGAIAPRVCVSTVDRDYLFKALDYLNDRFNLGMSLKGNWFELNQEYTSTLKAHLPEGYNHFLVNMATWQVYEGLKENRLGDGEVREKANHSYTSESSMTTVKNTEPLNQILYGPPGTGKTYHTIEAAVKAAEPNFYHGLKIDTSSGATKEQRSLLQAKFKELSDSKRIRFVTFHQSYGYEEFVEGLSAKVTANEQINYVVKDGIFKSISRSAKDNLEDSQKDQHKLDQEQKFDSALDEFKQVIMETETEGFPLTDACSITSIEDSGFRYGGNWGSSPIMKFEDLKALYLDGVTTRQEIKKNPAVSGLAKQHASYFIRALQQVQKRTPTDLPTSAQRHKQNYVLVIDEINRGNLSKIFGELITLIEPSKRKGQDEVLELTLPYSGKPFSVPDNLYIIGTMNTADRSLALMDTALRRRFDFVEMMPKPSLLKDCVVKHDDCEINLSELLTKLNERIEILYDREHTLGHAFFMPVKDLVEAGEQDKAFSALVSVFKNKIIPLLEEYFFEDWSKIRLVLADNQKTNNEPQQFVLEQKQKADDLKSLFGKGHNLDQYGQSVVKYTLADGNANVWRDAEAYIGIYKPTEKEPTQSPESQTEANNEPV